MTRRRRNDSSTSSERSHSYETRRSTSPSTSRSHPARYRPAHSTSSYDAFPTHNRDSGSRKYGEHQKDYFHYRRSHRSGDSRVYDERNYRSRNDDDDVAERISSDGISIKERERIGNQKERVKESRDSSRRCRLHKSKGIRKEFDKETTEKLSSNNLEDKRPKTGDHSNQSQDGFVNEHCSKEELKIQKEKPNFEPSGKLAEDTNTYRGVVIKYNEPSDAHIPKLRWRLYPFKGDEALPVLYIHRQSAYLIGRDRKIADLPVDHPSCSKQHAVFQYRLTPMDMNDGTVVKRVRPYIIDLGSTNGTYLNNERIESQRFVELREKDVLKFGFSTREFVLLNEKSHDVDEETVKKEEPF
uniref:FHA domain-containing protein n=1 Tax=Setaria digitata TaxID=48799 RepID=A0A915Q072_9BILA